MTHLHLHLNGEPVQVPDGTTVRDLVPEPAGLAVAVDGTVVPRADHPRRHLRAGERVEVVTAVQGG